MKEEDIRPIVIFNEFLQMAKMDAETFFASSVKVEIHCLACDSIGKHVFTKNNFDYCQCDKCRTIYVNPRPDKESFSEYYTNSLSSKYLATTFYKETADARREKILEPKAKMIKDILDSEDAKDYQIIDIGGGVGIFAEEIQKITNQPVIIVEPAFHMAEICRTRPRNLCNSVAPERQFAEKC